MEELYPIFGFLAIAFLDILFQIHKYLTQWRPVSREEVIWSWLRAEMSNPNHQFGRGYRNQVDEHGHPELDTPDFQDREENRVRAEIFHYMRGRFPIGRSLYNETQWYSKTLLIWGPCRKVRNPFVPSMEDVPLNQRVSLDGIVLWGHTQECPWIVLEGNHRWYWRNVFQPYVAQVYVGISDEKCEICR